MSEFGYFRSGEHRLSFCVDEPDAYRREFGVLFVHAAHGNRLGPHRMFVEAATRFNRLGYATCRFDLSGCGDSVGLVADSSIASDIFNTVNAVRFFQTNYGLDRVVLFGISKGASIAYATASQHTLPLAGMILLSALSSSRKVALQSVRNVLREYLLKLTEPAHLLKLGQGRISIPGILRTLDAAWKRRNRYDKIASCDSATRCPILFIYGGSDPIREAAMAAYVNECRRNNVPYTCHIIEKANHSFFHYAWKEEIIRLSETWLKQLAEAPS